MSIRKYKELQLCSSGQKFKMFYHKNTLVNMISFCAVQASLMEGLKERTGEKLNWSFFRRVG